ncbi:hypothetical protein BJ997_002277 [Cryobacterium roopkundense]|uniref:Uncharacterized protein n=1 Tax=Cryobacterium roopkundense TaxID=1001240 RepID=A0A7W8ZWX6_9MICO|nr:hypothetical protein [Cryobacterium roopkundense]
MLCIRAQDLGTDRIRALAPVYVHNFGAEFALVEPAPPCAVNPPG